jgi:hypothetical protein
MILIPLLLYLLHASDWLPRWNVYPNWVLTTNLQNNSDTQHEGVIVIDVLYCWSWCCALDGLRSGPAHTGDMGHERNSSNLLFDYYDDKAE